MIFNAEPDYITTLDSAQLVQLMKRLLLAEARLTGIPLRSASVPLQITVPDGGEDGRISWTGGGNSTPYIPARFTILQAKAQDLTESRVKNEILAKSGKGKPPALNEALAEVLANAGAYIIFCRQPMTGAKRKTLQRAIRDSIKSVGADPKAATAIEIYDANLIADWVNRHPAVALWLASLRASRNLAGFQTHEGWGRYPDMSVPWKSNDEPRFAPVSRAVSEGDRRDKERGSWTFEQAAAEVRSFLRDPKKIVRIFGPSGFGKTRFAYEVLSNSGDVSDEIDTASVLHCDGSISRKEVIKLALECADADVAMILVVDECNDELHQKLANITSRTCSRLRLITIDIETKIVQAPDTLSLRVEKADDKLISEIARGVAPKLDDTATYFITELADGFPRVAVLAAQLDGAGRETLASVEQVLERIVWAGKVPNAEAQRALEVAALFEWLGIEGRVESQSAFLASQLAEQTTARFVEYILSFQSRGIVTRRGNFIQVGPIPVANRLGSTRLATMTAAKLLDVFIRAPEELRASILRRLKWMDTSTTAIAFAERLLEPDMLGNFAALNTEPGSKALDRLVHVAPDAAARTIERVFGSLTIDELKPAKEARRYWVWSLEKLVFRTQTFDCAARLLRKLAAAETEDFLNSSTGVFQQLYHIYLSGTEADPAARLVVLDEGLSSTNEAERKVCTDALGHMLRSAHFSRVGGSEQIGSAEALEDWAPKTNDDIRDFFRAGMSRLTTIATSNQVHAPLARNHLSSHIRGLLGHLPVAEVRATIEAVTSHAGFWPEAITAVSQWLFFDRRKNAPEDLSKEVRQLYSDLLPSDPVELAVLYTHGWEIDLHDPDTNYSEEHASRQEFDYSARQAIKIAETIARDKELTSRAVERMACKEAHGIRAFTIAMMNHVADPIEVFKHAISTSENSRDKPNRGFFSGLISGARARDPELSKKFVKQALSSPKLRPHAVAIIGSGSLDSDAIDLIISLLKSGHIQPSECENLDLSRVDVNVLLPLLCELKNHKTEGLWTILGIIDRYLYGGTRKPTDELIAEVKRVLLAPGLIGAVRSNMDGHHLESHVRRLLGLGAIRAPYARRLARQLLGICRQSADGVFFELRYHVRKVLGLLLPLHAQSVWSEIARKLESKSWHARFCINEILTTHDKIEEDHLGRGLGIDIPPQQFLAWVRAMPEERAATAVDWLPIADRDTIGVLSWHPELEAYITEFGNTRGVLDALTSRLHPKSWSGDLARYLEPIVPLVQTWSAHPDPFVRIWASTQTERLRSQIRAERKRSDEAAVRYM
ncbi:hypothetical protein [Methylobrevis albus]|uniref:Uncharacterized protein n=1 Tax=Methylobrevis albus TaxID=2793297 RepID=A0A931I0I5_9HYPH|nr:hypothetical protein [Methylobrevis albus]MBH0236751.1 hypothetical protein [Methylobrevis albus]